MCRYSWVELLNQLTLLITNKHQYTPPPSLSLNYNPCKIKFFGGGGGGGGGILTQAARGIIVVSYSVSKSVHSHVSLFLGRTA